MFYITLLHGIYCRQVRTHPMYICRIVGTVGHWQVIKELIFHYEKTGFDPRYGVHLTFACEFYGIWNTFYELHNGTEASSFVHPT